MSRQKGSGGYTLIEILIVVMIIGILLAIAVPSMFNASERARANACRANLRQIQAAKEQWALVNRRPGTAIPTWANLVPQFLQRVPGGAVRRNLHQEQCAHAPHLQYRGQSYLLTLRRTVSVFQWGQTQGSAPTRRL